MRNGSNRMDFAAHRIEFTGINVRGVTMSGISAWKSVVECVWLPSNIRSLEFYFWASRNASAPVAPGLSKSWKMPVSANSVTFFHKFPKSPLQIPKCARVLEVTRRMRAKTGSFTLTIADTHPRLGMTNDIANLLCHFIGNWMIPHFCKSDVWHRKY